MDLFLRNVLQAKLYYRIGFFDKIENMQWLQLNFKPNTSGSFRLRRKVIREMYSNYVQIHFKYNIKEIN